MPTFSQHVIAFYYLLLRVENQHNLCRAGIRVLVPKQLPQKCKFYYFDLRMRAGVFLARFNSPMENLRRAPVDASSSLFSSKEFFIRTVAGVGELRSGGSARNKQNRPFCKHESALCHTWRL